MPTPLAWIDDELERLAAAGLRRQLVTRRGPQGGTIAIEPAESVDEKNPAAAAGELLNFGSNDYLGLAADPRLAEAAAEAAQAEGWGAGASPLVTGHSTSHRRLEARLAEFLGTEAALVFPSGFAANSGAIAALVGRGDVVLGDQKNHASLIDGCRLSRAEVLIYPHRDIDKLDAMLRASTAYRRRLIATDTLFSMDGDVAPLPQLAELAQRHNAMLLVDEAHATGVFGRHGRGIAEQDSVEARVSIRVGTLSKALGSAGGFVAGSRSLIEWLLNRARPYVFSTAHPPAVAAAAVAALDIVRDEPQRRTILLERAAALRQKLIAADLLVPASAASQIIPVVLGSAADTMRWAAELRARGMFVPGIRPPSVPEGESLLRISLSYRHTPEMLEQLVEALVAVRTESKEPRTK
jgi:8-amino-7-oxononanoate synthase